MKKFLEKRLEKASADYYSGNPSMSDDEFDALARAVNFKQVGTREGRVPHAYQMYSLQKIFKGEECPFASDDVIVTPKLDGSAISILYLEGELERVLTRGDGKSGIDITDKFKKSKLIPQTIVIGHEITQVTGEIVAPKSVPNSRNYAAGSLNLKDINEFNKRDLTFVAYDFQPHPGDSWCSDMKLISGWGFRVITLSDYGQFPQDGKVVRADNNRYFEQLGYTSHHPRGAFAIKTRQAGVVTELLDVEWNVGKSGAVSPVAILKPCVIGEATVSRATLHNIGYIEALGLEIGCDVEVIRSGEIIPRIVRRV